MEGEHHPLGEGAPALVLSSVGAPARPGAWLRGRWGRWGRWGNAVEVRLGALGRGKGAVTRTPSAGSVLTQATENPPAHLITRRCSPAALRGGGQAPGLSHRVGDC